MARLLCLSLMSCVTPLRSNAWRNSIKNDLHYWETDFKHGRTEIVDEQLHETPQASEYVPSSPIEFKNTFRNAIPACTLSVLPQTPVLLDQNDHSDSSDSDPFVAGSGHKRNHSQIASSPPQSCFRRFMSSGQGGGGQTQRTTSPFRTQRCVLSLQQGDLLHNACPKVSDHLMGRQTDKHLVSVCEVVHQTKLQLAENVDYHCEPFGECGGSGAPFQSRCDPHG